MYMHNLEIIYDTICSHGSEVSIQRATSKTDQGKNERILAGKRNQRPFFAFSKT
jgi:hypothetical protein